METSRCHRQSRQPKELNVKTPDGAEFRRYRRHSRKTRDQAIANFATSSRLQSTKNEPDKNEQWQLKERINDEKTSCSTGINLSPVKTRSGRLVRKPIRL